MKKGKKVALIIALVCVVLGAAISICALAAVGHDLSQLNTVKYTAYTHEISEDFSGLRIVSAACDVRLLPAQDGQCKVVCAQTDQVTYAVGVENGILTIRHSDERSWYDTISINFNTSDEMAILVYLPQTAYDSLYVNCTSGDISIPNCFTFADAQLHSTSGEITCTACVDGTLLLESVSGNLEISGCTASALKASTTSGEIDISRVNAASLSVSSTSGDADLEDVIVAGELSVDTTSGEIELERCDGNNLLLSSVSGDISGSLLSGKQFDVQTISGETHVPPSASGGQCKIRTTSGEIEIKIVN